MQNPLDLHYGLVAKAITDGRVVPFLGAGANLCDRPDDNTHFERGQYLPSGSELAEYLANSFGCPLSEDLARVSQYVALLGPGYKALYQALRELFDVNYPPTLLHKLLAVLPAVLRDKGLPPRYQLIVTTNYDDVLERTFHAAREEFDLVSYMAAEGDSKGKFLHWSYAFKPKTKREDFEHEEKFKSEVERERKKFYKEFWKAWPPPGIESRLIRISNEYSDVAIDKRPVILKIHGAVDRVTPPEMLERLDSFVITDEDYIDYLTRADISTLVPMNVAAKFNRSNFLFLGYSLRDWNLRVILRRIWGQQNLKNNSWGILLKPEDLDQIFWMKRDIQLINAPLCDYVKQLIKGLQATDHITKLDKRLKEMEERATTGAENQKALIQSAGGEL
jgi:hypothetical protein